MPREMNTPPGENEKEEDFANTGSNRNAKLHRKVGRKGGAWHRRGKKCVIWFQEGSPPWEEGGGTMAGETGTPQCLDLPPTRETGLLGGVCGVLGVGLGDDVTAHCPSCPHGPVVPESVSDLLIALCADPCPRNNSF